MTTFIFHVSEECAGYPVGYYDGVDFHPPIGVEIRYTLTDELKTLITTNPGHGKLDQFVWRRLNSIQEFYHDRDRTFVPQNGRNKEV